MGLSDMSGFAVALSHGISALHANETADNEVSLGIDAAVNPAPCSRLQRIGEEQRERRPVGEKQAAIAQVAE